MPRKIEISHKTIIFTVILLLSLWVLYLIKDIIFGFFVAVLVMFVLNPTVNKLSTWKIPRVLSITLIYVILFLLIGGAVAALAPPLIEQTTSFANKFPSFLDSLINSPLINERLADELVSQLAGIPSGAAKFTVSVFSNLAAVFTVLIFAFYLLIARNKLDDHLADIFGDKKRKGFEKLIDLLEREMGGWVRGQIVLMFSIGLSSFIGLSLLGIPFALPLSIFAGLTEIITYIGPFIGAAPAVIIGFGTSPVIGFATIALYILIQQLENYILVPKVMQRATGVDPITTLLALAIGFRLAGILGAVLSLPIFIVIRILARQYVFVDSN